MQRLFGAVLAAVGLLMALAGNLITPGELGPAGPAGLLMGAFGYLLGARLLGAAAVVLSLVG